MSTVLKNVISDAIVCPRLEIAETFWRRTVGLLGRSQLSTEEGLIIIPCQSIHTFFMRFPIDVLFLRRDRVVVRIVENTLPWQLCFGTRDAVAVVELAAGVAAAQGVKVGDQLEW